MSDKIILTSEQEDAIIRIIKKMDRQAIIQLHANIANKYDDQDSVLNQLSLDELIKVLYVKNSYEVEPEYKENDWVLLEDGQVAQLSKFITHNDGSTNWALDIWSNYFGRRHEIARKEDEIKRLLTDDEASKAKDQWFFAENGRKPWELREGDMLISRFNKNSCDVKFVEATDETGTLLVNGEKDEFLETIEMVKDKYIVLAFVDDRKDLKMHE